MVGFFIQRPVFASAIAAILVLAGGICFFLLPVSQFPEITPPQVVVSATLGAIYVSQMQIDVYSRLFADRFCHADRPCSGPGSPVQPLSQEQGAIPDLDGLISWLLHGRPVTVVFAYGARPRRR